MPRPALLAALVLLACGAAWYAGGREADYAEQLRAEQSRAGDMDRECRVLAWRCAERERLTEGLVGGRLTLAHVADEFARLNRLPPAAVGGVWEKYPAPTERESAARQVLSWVEQYLLGRADLTPARRAAILRGLEGQLAALAVAAPAGPRSSCFVP